MPIARIYQIIPLQTGATVNLDEKASHYLGRVLRAEIGSEVVLFNGKGGEFAAVITQINKKFVQVNVGEQTAKECESPINIHLAQGIAKGEKMDFIVQKAVELGVSKIIPLLTERCNVRLSHEREEKRLQHWQAVAVSACEQSGRNRVPEVAAPIEYETWLTQNTFENGFVLSPHVSAKLPSKNKSSDATLTLLIGPEGGLSQVEVDMALQKGFQPLNLGPRVLRTETATLTAISILQFAYGDLG